MDESNINRILVFGSQLLAVFLVFAGSILQQSQLKSARPLGSGTQLAGKAGSGDRYARLWQDPLEEFQSFAIGDEPPSRAAVPAGEEASEAEDEGGEEKRLLIWNVIDARPTPDAIERRRRTRYATVSALAVFGYMPTYDSKLRAIHLPENWRGPPSAESTTSAESAQASESSSSREGQASESGSEREERELLVCYLDRFELAEDVNNSSEWLPETVYVGWHPQQPLEKPGGRGTEANPHMGYPIDTVREIEDAANSIDWKAAHRVLIFHHGSSDQFKNFYRNLSSAELAGELPYFINATAPVRMLFPDGDPCEPNGESERRMVAAAHQAATSDDELVQELSAELHCRIPSLARTGRSQRIVILTESDGSYSRNLVKLITERFSGTSIEIEVYSYLRGLDGLQRERDLDVTESDAPSGAMDFIASAYQAGLSERSWGTGQYDYLRRLASDLRSGTGSGTPIVAVGVLGSDVYDKLNVLQAVHSVLPHLVYFTTDLDGVYYRREYLPFTRNLVIASGEGLEAEPGRIDWPGASGEFEMKPWHIPPMRDSYQTGLVHTIFELLPNRKQGAKKLGEAGAVKVRELGAAGFVDLGGSHDSHDSWGVRFDKFFLALMAPTFTGFLIVALGLLNALIILRVVSGREVQKGKDTWELGPGGRRFLECEAVLAGVLVTILAGLLLAAALPVVTPFRIVCGVVVGGVALAAIRLWRRKNSDRDASTFRRPAGWFGRASVLIGTGVAFLVLALFSGKVAEDGTLFHEPLGLVSGVGIWPSILLRALAFLVGLLLLLYTARMILIRGKALRRSLGSLDASFAGVPQTTRTERFLKELDKAADWISLARFRRILERFVPFLQGRQASGSGEEQPASRGEERPSEPGPNAPEGLSRFLLPCEEPKPRSRRVALVAILYFAITAVFFMIWTPNVPARGGVAFFLEKFTLSAGVGLYIVHLCFCIELHLFAFWVIDSFRTILSRQCHAFEAAQAEGERPDVPEVQAGRSRAGKGRSTKRAPATKKAAKPRGDATGKRTGSADESATARVELPPIDKLRELVKTTGELTNLVGVTLLYPLTILALLLLSRLRVFDDWNMTPSLILTFFLGGAILVAASVWMVVAGGRFRAQVERVEKLLLDQKRRAVREMEAAAAERKEDQETIVLKTGLTRLEEDVKELQHYREGVFAPWYRRPIFTALFVGVAILGSLGIAEPVASLFAR